MLLKVGVPVEKNIEGAHPMGHPLSPGGDMAGIFIAEIHP